MIGGEALMLEFRGWAIFFNDNVDINVMKVQHPDEHGAHDNHTDNDHKDTMFHRESAHL